MRPIRHKRYVESGFTLIEAIAVITITGILFSIVAVFIRGSVTSYFDTARRAELTDIADTALRRMDRELRLSVPDTVRVAPGVTYIEVLAAKAGGRYDSLAAAPCFTSTQCSSITTTGSVLETIAGTPVVAAGPSGGRYRIASIVAGQDRIVIYNQYNNSGNDCTSNNPSAYCGQNVSTLTGVVDGGSQDAFSFASQQFFPAGGSPSRRFQITEGPVTYACNATGATVNGLPPRSLTRFSNYAITAIQPVSALAVPLSTAASSLIATNVFACSFNYAGGVFERWGVVDLYLELTEQGETVSLYHEVHINNVP
jgi:MSHA biogenesis protein MshO